MPTMAHRHHLPATVVIVVVIVAQLMPCATGYPWPVCGGSNFFKPNSKYQAHLNLAAATLPKNASTSPALYAAAAIGSAPDELWATALCRGDVSGADCLGCLTQAFQDLENDCSFDRDATIYYDACTLRYSGARVAAELDVADTGPVTYHANVTSDPPRFNRLVAALVNATADRAAHGSSARRFATGEAGFDREVPEVYALAQCTPDQTPAQCRECLAGIVASYLGTFRNNVRGRVLSVNCTYRYDTSPFFNGAAMVRIAAPSTVAPAPAPATAPAGGGGRKRKHSVLGVVLAVVLPTLATLNLVFCLCLWRTRQRQVEEAKPPYPMYSTEAEDVEMVDSMLIGVSTLRAATGDFAESNKLGDGGFGAVYKGVLPNGDEIAVKRLSQASTQGLEELKNEFALVAKMKHRNLVNLVGVCLEQQERLLVYEFVPNRSLDLILFDAEKREQLDWGQRWKIINGVARGLQYMHEDSQLKVVHRDLKASNILLDANMNPKISDFGLARIFGRDQTHAVTNCVVGTNGYMAPEYLMRGNYSVKSDAFSFGVIVLEIVTGRKNSDCYNSQQSQDLLTTVWEHWQAGTVAAMVDPCMGGSFPEGEALRCIHVGLLCVQGDPVLRPAMSSVVTMLGSDTVTLQAPSKPAFFATNATGNLALLATVRS